VIISPLGAGGMGEVYLAEDTRLKRRVALKILPASLASDERAHKRLLREAQSIAAVDHSNICTVYEVGEAAGHGFIAMQYIEGETLAARLDRGPTDLDTALSIARQVAQALAEAHRHGIVHRDIKPQNIMITKSGQVKVLDFGLAKTVAPLSDARTTSLLTEYGAVAGTVPYMSPEQARGEPVDERSDVFSFGSVLYEMVGRRHPFSGGTGADTISMILMRDPPPLESGVPPEVRRIIQKCLAKDRARRYQTVSDLVIDLEAPAPEGTPAATVPGATAPARRSTPLVWIAAAAMALGIGFLIWCQLA